MTTETTPEPRFGFCPSCGRELAPPAKPEENPNDEAFDLMAPRCSCCALPWMVCACVPASEGKCSHEVPTTMPVVTEATVVSASFLSEVAGKVRRGELGPVDASMVLTIDSISAPPRVGSAAHRLDRGGAVWLLRNMAASLTSQEQATSGGIILPGRTH